MRPLNLVIKGFKPFKERQEIDFSELDFFVIRGPTGSGKSSLLEAIMFALYGDKGVELPYEHLVHKGSNSAFVDFTFKVGKETYRIQRVISKKGGRFAGEVRFYVEGVPKVISSTAVSREVAKLLGVDAEQFKKIFFLPQGRYDSFLKGKPAERRELILSLLNLEIYSKLAEEAKREREKLRSAIDKLEGSLTLLEEVDENLIGNLERERKTAEEKFRSVELRLEELREQLKPLEEKANLYEQKLELERRLEELRSEELENLRREVESLRKLYPHLSELVELLRLKEERKRLLLRSEEIEKTTSDLEGEKRRLLSLLSEVEREINLLEEKRARETLLEEALGELKKLGQLVAELKRELAQIEELKEKTQKLGKLLSRKEEKLLQLREEKQKLQKELEKLDFDLQREVELKVLLEKAGRRDELLKEKRRLENLFKEKEKELIKVEKKLKEVQKELEELKELKKEYLAYLLLKEVSVGEPCPVCGRPLEEHPSGLREVSFDLSRFEELEALVLRLKEVRASLLAEIESLKGRLGELEKKLFQFEDLESTEKLKEELSKLLSLKKRAVSEEEKLKRVEEELKELSEEISALRARREEQEKLLSRREREVNEKLDRLKGEIKKLASELFPELGPVKFSELIEKVKGELNAIRSRKEELKEQRHKLEVNLSKLEEKLASLRREKEKLKEELEEVSARIGELNNVVKSLGLENQNLQTTVKRLRDFPKWENLLREREKKIASLELKLKDLNSRLGNFEEESLKLLEELKEKHENLRREREKLKLELGLLDERLSEARQKLEQKKKLLLEREGLEKKLHLVEALINDFRSDRLVDFVVGRAIEEIVGLAGDYLYRLTERYRFISEGGTIEVLDLFTDARRPVESLSGGETFLASLSFALGLGEFLGSEAKVESLFIDEGFGTLDRETLAKTGELFEIIKSRIDKVVGVITHVDALADLFDRQIRIMPSPGGSKIEVV